MEKYFGNPYRGDPGVPHTDLRENLDRILRLLRPHLVRSLHVESLQPVQGESQRRQENLIRGLSTSARRIRVELVCNLLWHDKAMMFEHYHWKKAMEKNQPYQFKWNQYMSKPLQDSYYFNWPIYFP